MMLDDDIPLPGPIPAVIFQKRLHQEQLNGSIQPSTSGDTEESIPDRIDTEENDQPGLQPVSVESIVTGKVPAPDDLQKQPQQELHEDTCGSNANPEVTDKENLEVSHVPPIFVVPVDTATAKEPIKSKTLQTRRKRRKKKKKKQPTLKRVSSIQSMETITELDEGGVNEEGSEFDGSEYSEYSTDDEDDRLLMVHTPDGNEEDGNSPKVSPGPVIPPSPIREEPKIRRLPPPWI